jgi:hypothetical protein
MKGTVLPALGSGDLGQGVPIYARGQSAQEAGAPPPFDAIEFLSSVAVTCLGSANGAGPSSAIDTTGASLLVAAVSWYPGGFITSLTDSEGNTWTPLTEYAAGDGAVRLYYVINPSTSATHTFSVSGTNCYPALAVASFIRTAAFDDENGAASASATTRNTGSVTPAGDNELFVTGLAFNDTSLAGDATINSGFTVAESQSDAVGLAVGIAYKIQTTGGAENPTWTSPAAAGRMAAAIATFEHE